MRRTRDSKLAALKLRRIRRITAGLVHHHTPTFSQDGRFIVSRLGEGAESFWAIADRKGRVARVLEGPAEGSASFAPDGSLAYGRQVGATCEIWQLPTLNSGSGAPRRLLGGDGRLYRDPAYSPDGRFLAYIADDGLLGSMHRLWLLDLANEEHHLLCAELQAAHPIWSETGDCIYFEAMVGAASAIYCVAPSGQALTRLTEPGYRRPAPLCTGLLLGEQTDATTDGESQLVLLDHRSAEKTAHAEVPLALQRCARDPAVVRRKKSVLVAWAMPCRVDPDQPHRFDLHVGVLDGLPALPRRRRFAKDAAETRETPAGLAAELHSQEAAPTANSRNPDDASVWLDRPFLCAEQTLDPRLPSTQEHSVP